MIDVFKILITEPDYPNNNYGCYLIINPPLDKKVAFTISILKFSIFSFFTTLALFYSLYEYKKSTYST